MLISVYGNDPEERIRYIMDIDMLQANNQFYLSPNYKYTEEVYLLNTSHEWDSHFAPANTPYSVTAAANWGVGRLSPVLKVYDYIGWTISFEIGNQSATLTYSAIFQLNSSGYINLAGADLSTTISYTIQATENQHNYFGVAVQNRAGNKDYTFEWSWIKLTPPS